MPLRTACSSCGKKLQVRDELAGKKVKCPGCQTVFVAASVNGETAVKAAPTRPAPAAPKLPDTVKDKVSSKPMAKKPVAPPPPPIDEDEERDDDEEQQERAERRSKKRKQAAGGSLLWLWLVLAGVVVIGGGVAAYLLFFSGPTAPVPVAQNKTQPVVNEKPPPPPPPAQVPAGPLALMDLVPGDAIFFISGSPDLLKAQALAPLAPQIQAGEPEFQKQLGFPLRDVERASAFSVVGVDRFQQPGGPVVTVVQTNKPFDPEQVSKAMKSGNMGKSPDVAFEILSDQTVVAGPRAMLQEFKNKKGQVKPAGVLERAIKQAGTSKGVVAAAVFPPDAAQQVAPLLPQEAAPFLKTQAVLASADLSDRLVVNATLIMSDVAAAEEAKKTLDGLVGLAPFLLGSLGKDPKAAQLAKVAEQTLKELKIVQQDKEITITVQASANTIAAAIKGVAASLQGAGAAMSGDNNLKQIGLAWHNHHDVMQMFPPQTVGKGLSWRVAILPYLEQGELYKQFNLKEPWDSPQNKKLIARMPPIYMSPGRKAPPGFTYFQTFVGPNTVNKDKFKGGRFQEIKDGTSNTILVAEADQAVEWTKPADIEVAPGQPIRLGGANPGHTSAVNGDGSIRHLPRNLDQQILRWLIDPSDGNPIPGF